MREHETCPSSRVWALANAPVCNEGRRPLTHRARPPACRYLEPRQTRRSTVTLPPRFGVGNDEFSRDHPVSNIRHTGNCTRSRNFNPYQRLSARVVTGCHWTTNLGAPSAIGKRLEAALGFVTPASNLLSPYPLKLLGVVGQ